MFPAYLNSSRQCETSAALKLAWTSDLELGKVDSWGAGEKQKSRTAVLGVPYIHSTFSLQGCVVLRQSHTTSAYAAD